MRRGQTSSIYLGILTVISIAIFALVLIWSMNIRDTNSEFLAEEQINLLIEKVESDIYFIENNYENTSETIFRIRNNIPNHIGTDLYSISLRASGLNNSAGAFLSDPEIVVSRQSSSKFGSVDVLFIKQINTALPIIKSYAFSSNSEYILEYNTSAGLKFASQ